MYASPSSNTVLFINDAEMVSANSPVPVKEREMNTKAAIEACVFLPL